MGSQKNFAQGKLAVLFDLDGTLSDSLPLIQHNYQEVFAEMNLPWDQGAVMNWIGVPLMDIARHFAGEKAQEFYTRYQHCFQRDHDAYTKLFPGTLAMLETLKEHQLKIALVTSKGRPGTMRTVHFVGLAPYLDAVVTAHDVEKHKPHAEPVQKALSLLQVPASQAVFVGDSPFDLQAGQQAGTEVLGVAWGMASVETLAAYQPKHVLACWEELYQYL